MQPCTYILCSKRNGTLYTGVTSNIAARVFQHKEKLAPGFTARHNVNRLVWYELHSTMENAIRREKTIKGWPRKWKLDLIESQNPQWDDLYHQLI